MRKGFLCLLPVLALALAMLLVSVFPALTIAEPDPGSVEIYFECPIFEDYVRGLITPPIAPTEPVTVDDVKAITSVYVSGSDVTSLVGIEYFFQLTELNCSNIGLSSLDIGGLTNLTDLDCSGNLLTALNLDGLTSLTDLDCRNNLLTVLTVSSLSALENLNCSDNMLTSLDLSGNSLLKTLDCSSNALTSLNAGGSLSLLWVTCNDNYLDYSYRSVLQSLVSEYTFFPQNMRVDAVANMPFSFRMIVDPYDWVRVGAALPDGIFIVLQDDGIGATPEPLWHEIYGIIQAPSSYPYTLSFQVPFENSALMEYEVSVAITLRADTAGNVNGERDADLIDVTGQRIPGGSYAHSYLHNLPAYLYSRFSHLDFVAFYINGMKQNLDEDFDYEEGSTVITIYAQTVQKYPGSNTFVAEFRETDPETGAQTLVTSAAKLDTNAVTPGPDTGSGSSGPPAATPPPPPPSPAAPPAPGDFLDVLPGDWFYAAVKWAFDNKLMVGVGGGLFAPNETITPAQLATVLARLAKIDMAAFAGVADAGVPQGEWYTNTVTWAISAGLFGDSPFTGEDPFSRGDTALMLVSFFEYLGIEIPPLEEDPIFPDREDMSPQEYEAFQILCQMGVFKGKEGGTMDPKGYTTRAELAVLLRRVSAWIEEHQA